MPHRVAWTSIVVAAIGISIASACTIPVFRYALERWESDRFQVIVYYAGQLSAEQDNSVKELEERSAVSGGPLNIEVIRYDVRAPAPKLLDADRPDEATLPTVEVRARNGQAGWSRRWQGPLASAIAEPGLFDSPARAEIVQRILAGNSAVWLFVAPDAVQGATLEKSLQQSLNEAAAKLPPPQGIGQPGSELYASVPLELRFSVVTISHSDAAEQRFLEMLATSTNEWRADVAYVVPVFGRCRALDIIPHADLDPATLDEVAGFICSACSCQVKQANPGFDLLVSVNWEEKLFGATIPEFAGLAAKQLNTASDTSSGNATDGRELTQYVPIPAGRDPESNDPAVNSLALAPETTPPAGSTEADAAAAFPSPAANSDLTIGTNPNATRFKYVLLIAASLALLAAIFFGFRR